MPAEFRSQTKGLKLFIASVIFAGLLFYIDCRLSYQEWYGVIDILVIGLTLIIATGIYVYYGFTNHDFFLTDNKLEIANRFSFFRKRTSIELGKIRKVLFKDDTFINMFSGHKFIIIEYFDNDNECRTTKIYCNGLEYDYNLSKQKYPTFDDFMQMLTDKGITCEWTRA